MSRAWAVRDAAVRLRDAVPLPAFADRALSALMLRRGGGRGLSYGGVPALRIDITGYGCCAVCEARWRAGRCIKHGACADRLASGIEWFLRLRREPTAAG